MGVKGQIILQTKSGVYISGEPVKGILKYSLDKPTKFTSIDICLVGKGKCQWSETDSDDKTTYYGNKEDYINASKYVLAGRGNEKLLAGTYDYPFEFFLTEDIPTSFIDKTCTIEYKVIATFVKDNCFGTKNKFEANVTVYGKVKPVSPEPLRFGLDKDVYSFVSSEKVEVKAEIERTCVTPGENIKLNLKVINDSDVSITIKTELVKYSTYLSDNKRTKKIEESVKTTTAYSPTIKGKSAMELNCVIPTLPSLYSIQHTKIMIGEYKLRLTAKLLFPHTNAVGEVPVVIGERRGHLGATIVGAKDEFQIVGESFE